VLVCGTLVYSRGDEVQSKKDHLEYEAHAAEEGEAQPSMLMPGLSWNNSDPRAVCFKELHWTTNGPPLLRPVFCQLPSPSLSAEGLPLSSPFLSASISLCCLDLLSWCLLAIKAARVAIPFVSLGNFTRLCCHHVVHASGVLIESNRRKQILSV